LIKKLNYQLITDDRTCITNKIESLYILNSDNSIKVRSINSDKTKKSFTPQIQFKANLQDKNSINYLIFPYLSAWKIKAKLITKEKQMEIISKQVLSTIRGSDYCVFDDSGKYISFAPCYPINVSEQIGFDLNHLCQTIPAYSIYGSVSYICDQIETLHSKRL